MNGVIKVKKFKSGHNIFSYSSWQTLDSDKENGGMITENDESETKKKKNNSVSAGS